MITCADPGPVALPLRAVRQVRGYPLVLQTGEPTTAPRRRLLCGQTRDIPESGAELVAQLERRHARLMAARPDKRPGQFKRGGEQARVIPVRHTGTGPRHARSRVRTWRSADAAVQPRRVHDVPDFGGPPLRRSEEHTSE